MRPEFFEFSLEKLVFLVGNGFLVENKHVGDIIVMNLINQ